MATNKQRIQAYIDQRLFEVLETERIKWGISQSQALERILTERYNTKLTGNDSPSIEQWKFLEELDRKQRANNAIFEQIFKRLDGLERVVSELFREPLVKVSDLNGDSNSELLASDLNNDSNSGLLNSDLSSDSDSKSLASDLSSDSDSKSLASDLSSDSDSKSLTSDLSSDSDSKSLDRKPDKDQLWVICKINRNEPYCPVYWTGSFKQGFSNDLDRARAYQERNLKQTVNRIAKSEHNADKDKRELLSYKTLADLEKMAAAIASPSSL